MALTFPVRNCSTTHRKELRYTRWLTYPSAVVLRRLPVEQPEELVLLGHDGPYGGSNRGMGTFSNPMYRDLSARNEVLTGIAASKHEDVNLTRGGHTERVTAMLVSGNYFEVLGVERYEDWISNAAA